MKYFDHAENRRFFFLAFYCSFVWFVTRLSLPFGSFQNIPVYLPLTLISFVYLPPRASFWTMGFTLFLLAYELLKIFQPGLGLSMRSMLSAAAIGIIVPSCGFAFLELLKFPEERVLRWLRVTLYLFGASQLGEVALVAAGVLPNPYTHYLLPFLHRYSGTLMEPSHLAPVLAPLIFIAVSFPRFFVEKLGRRCMWVLAWIVFAGLSSTLLLVLIMAAGFSLVRRFSRLEIGGIFLFAIAGVVMVALFAAIPAFSARLIQAVNPQTTVNLSVSEALSVLVLIKGYQMTSYAMAHFPLGVHALDMQSLAPFSSISFISPFMFDANSNDGASLFFKGICEYGYLWIFVMVFALGNFLIRSARQSAFDFIGLLKVGFIFALFATFVRGTSYFHDVAPMAVGLTLFSIWECLRTAATTKVRSGTAYR